MRRIGALVILPLGLACGDAQAGSGACEGFAERELGITGAEYWPCADEIMAALDSIRPQVQAYRAGDAGARDGARSHLRKLRGLLRQIGIERDYRSLEPGAVTVKWPDAVVREFNSAIFQSSVMYAAALASRRDDEAGPVARDNFEQGVRAHDDARRFHPQIR